MVRVMNPAKFAARAWNLILTKPASITIKRGSTMLAAQTVRVELSNAQVEREGSSNALVASRDAIVFGVRDHEDDDIPDTNIKRNDLFEYDGQTFRVMDLIKVVGGIQAHCEVIG